MGQAQSSASNDTKTDETPSKGSYPRLYLEIAEDAWPVVYSSAYTFSILGKEKFGALDMAKATNIWQLLVHKEVLDEAQFVEPLEVSEAELRTVHSQAFMENLSKGSTLVELTGFAAARLLPNFMVQRSFLQPFRVQTGGTILIGKLAIEHGWAINLGGGSHHCSSERVGLACPYADITLNIRYLRDNFPDVKKVMIVDLDVHQGNGYARDFLHDDDVFIMDVYNCSIYPRDEDAKKAIKCKVELKDGTEDEEYLELVKKHVEEGVEGFVPQYILYNAGTDIIKGDPLGHFNITPQGIIERDKIVFSAARSRNIPIAMVTSGGFIKSIANVIADSIENLHTSGLIKGPKSNVIVTK